MKQVTIVFETDMPENLLHSLLGQFAEDAMGEDRMHELDVTIVPVEESIGKIGEHSGLSDAID